MDILRRKDHVSFMEFLTKLYLAADKKDDQQIHQTFSLKLVCPDCQKTFIARDGIDLDEFNQSGLSALRCPFCKFSLIERNS